MKPKQHASRNNAPKSTPITRRIFSRSKLSMFTLGLAAAMTLNISPAEARGACRDYTKSTFLNGRLEVGFAQACHRHGNRWEVVSLSAGPIELRSMVMEMVHRDLYVIDPYYTLFDGGYPVVYHHRVVSPPPARVVYHTPPPRVVYVQPRPVVYKTAPPRHVVHHHHHSHTRKHDARHNNRNRHGHGRNHDSRRR
ncbi:MAG: hypothetical protein ACK4VI_01235 [Alphaproteobacteria bacterium]